MKGSESRDRERKKEILDLFKPRKNGVFLHYPQKGVTVSRHDKKPGKVRNISSDRVGEDFV